ncbi:MAG: hypothetical protein ACK52I_33360 [Pseudomonadota bacterium]
MGPASITLHNQRKPLLLCPGNWAASCPFIAREFYAWAVDFFLVLPRGGTSSHVLIPVWCFTELDHQTFEKGLRLLEEKLGTVVTARSIYPLILTFQQPNLEKTFFQGQGHVVSLDAPAQSNLDKLQALLFTILEQA